MGLITWAIAVLALILGGLSFYMQITGSKPIDPQKCTVLTSVAIGSGQQTTCNSICGQKTCLLGLSKFNEQITIANSPEFNSQENLIACNEEASFGTIQEDSEIETYSINCVCCD